MKYLLTPFRESYFKYELIYNIPTVKKVLCFLNHNQKKSWNQPVLSNESQVKRFAQ